MVRCDACDVVRALEASKVDQSKEGLGGRVAEVPSWTSGALRPPLSLHPLITMVRLSALSSLLVCSLAVMLLLAAPAAADFYELAEEQLIYGQRNNAREGEGIAER